MFIETRQIFHWRRVFHKGRDFSYCKQLIAGVMMFTASVANVGAEPAGGTVRAGGDATVTIGTHTLIEQRSNRVDIDWTSFDTLATPVRESVTFNQLLGSHSLAVNHISGSRTRFDGDLISNGRVFLINQNGITFGSTAQVNVGSLLATTSELDPKSSTLDQFVFKDPRDRPNIGNDRSIINKGRITVSDGGFAVLAAPYVANIDSGMVSGKITGFIKADNDIDGKPGQVVLASTKDFTLNVDLRGDNLITFSVPAEVLDDAIGVDSNGTLQSRSGYVYLTTSMVNEVVNGVVNLSGIVDADQFVSTSDGSVEMVASADTRRYDPRGGTIKVDSVGDINIDGGADIHAIGGDRVSATFHAKRDINVGVTGGPVAITLCAGAAECLKVDSPAVGDNDGIPPTAHAVARLEMTASSTTSGGKGTLTIADATIEVTADASDYMESSSVSAVATAVLQGPDVEINADINVHARADATGMEYDPTPADALAVFDVLAIEFTDSGNVNFEERGDLTMVGDITVSANSSTVNSMNSKATANTMLVASGSTDATGEINVDADATSGFGEYIEGASNSADANAALVQLGGTPQGLIPLLRAVSLHDDRVEALGTLSDILTLANLDDVLDVFKGFDFGHFGSFGPGSVSYTGDSNISARANFYTTGSENGTSDPHGEGKAEATSAAYYVAGGDVYINTDPIEVYSEANADYKEIPKETPDEPGDLFVETEARSFLVAAAGLDEYFNGGSENEPHSEITVLGNLSTEAREQASLNSVPEPGMYNQLAAAVTALVATGDITVRGADPLADATPAFVQGRSSQWQGCHEDPCENSVEEGVDGLKDLAASSKEGLDQNRSAHLAQLVIHSFYGDIDIQPKSFGNDVQPTGLFTDPIGPSWPGDLPLRFDANGRMLVATGTDATKPPQIVALDSNIEAALLSGGDPSVLLPPTAAGGCVAAGRDAFTISSPGYFERMISASCETEE